MRRQRSNSVEDAPNGKSGLKNHDDSKTLNNRILPRLLQKEIKITQHWASVYIVT